MNPLLKTLSESERKRMQKKKPPGWMAPMKATLTDDRFSDKNWLYERKLDGERCLAFRKGKNIRLLSRNQKKLREK